MTRFVNPIYFMSYSSQTPNLINKRHPALISNGLSPSGCYVRLWRGPITRPNNLSILPLIDWWIDCQLISPIVDSWLITAIMLIITSSCARQLSCWPCVFKENSCYLIDPHKQKDSEHFAHKHLSTILLFFAIKSNTNLLFSKDFTQTWTLFDLLL